MVASGAYSVVVPVRNEAAVLPQTVPAILAATEGDAAEIVYVCNGCTDGSAETIRSLAGAAVKVVELTQAGKTAALNAGDEAVRHFPRFYIDADVVLGRRALADLLAVLATGEADLVAPRLAFDVTGSTPLARRLAEVWLALPYAREAAFQVVIGLSAAGRSRWQRFPDVLGDDVFVAAMVPPERRRVVPSAIVTTRPPSCLKEWIRARTRWRRGERALARMGLPLPSPHGQRRALLAMLVRPRTSVGVLIFAAVRLAADLVSHAMQSRMPGWLPDRSALTARRATPSDS